MENNKDYIDSGFDNKVPDYTDFNYSTPVGLQCTNRISETSNKYDHHSLFDPWMLHPTLQSNKQQIDSEHKLMEPVPEKPSVTKVIDDYPYRPCFTQQSFGVLTENHK